jgi:CDGSH-type Zn-finger protein
MLLITIFAILVLAGVAKLVYDTQQKKKQTPTKKIEDFEFKDDFQKLAGIKPIETTGSELPTNVTTKKLNEQIVEALLKAAENSEFPKPDETINVRTTKIGTIDTNFGNDNDPLASVPMSRVSKEAKQKMAEIAKEDIVIQLEKNVERIAAVNPTQNKCGCGRSETGFCTGLHKISKTDWANGVKEIPAPKKKSNPKQMDGTKTDVPFVKTKRTYKKKTPKA